MPDPIIVTTSGPITASTGRQTILDVIKAVCPVIGLNVPQTVFSSTDREHVELAALANEMAQRIAIDSHDWTKLKSLATITGDGLTLNFSMPDDYARMLKTTRLYSSANTTYPLTHYPDTDRWLAMDVQNFTTGIGSWTLIGEQIYIKPALPNTATVSFYYLSNLYAYSSTDDLKEAFTSDDDAFRLDSRLLRLGMIWQWKANKGFPYQEDMATFETAMSVLVGGDKGSNILTIGGRRINADVTYPYPGPLGP